MGIALVTLGRHGLNTKSLETVGRQLSDAFDMNLSWGHFKDEGEDVKFIEEGKVIKYPDKIVAWLVNNTEEYGYVNYHIFMEGPLYYLSIGREMVEFSVKDWPHSAWHFEYCFGQPITELEDYIVEDMKTFRLLCRDTIRKLGGTRVFHFPERGLSGFLEDAAEEMNGKEFEEYILSGHYLDKALQGGNEWKREASHLFYLPDFLSGKDPFIRQDGADVYYDDFADLK